MTEKLKYPLIRKKRKMYLLGLRELAEKIGISYQALCDYENGKYPPMPETFKKLKQALHLEGTVEEFFGRKAMKVRCPPYDLNTRCCVKGCKNPIASRKMCKAHYTAWKKQNSTT